LRDARGLRFDRYDDLWRWPVVELKAFWLHLRPTTRD
jgi:hypothetical protein